MDRYDHLVKIDRNNKTLAIYRVLDGRELELFTLLNLPDSLIQEHASVFKECAQQLGENILLDSPAARKIFNL